MKRTVLLAAGVALSLALAGSAQAAVWNYDFEGFADDTDWGQSSQVMTTEGWTIGGSSTLTYTRGLIKTDGDTKRIETDWYNYVQASVGYATGGTGNITSIGDMATAPAVEFTWDHETSAYYSSTYGDHHHLTVSEGATTRLDLGQSGNAPPTAWQFITPAGTYAAALIYANLTDYVVKIAVDLVNGTGTVSFNGTADANLTDVDLVGSSGVDLRNLTDVGFYSRGGWMRDVNVETVPEPAAMSLLILGGAGMLLRRRRR